MFAGRHVELTVDSGAGDSAADCDALFPEFPLEVSPGQKAGRHFVGPGNEMIENKGQKRIELEEENR